MAEQKNDLARILGYYGQIGITFAASIFIGLGVGIYVDQKLLDGKTAPICTFIGLAFGIAAGFKMLFDVLTKNKQEKNQSADEKK